MQSLPIKSEESLIIKKATQKNLGRINEKQEKINFLRLNLKKGPVMIVGKSERGKERVIRKAARTVFERKENKFWIHWVDCGAVREELLGDEKSKIILLK